MRDRLPKQIVAAARCGLMAWFVLAVPPVWADGASVGGTDASGGTIKGVVKFEGRQAKRKPIRMAADAYCQKAHGDASALTERFVFGDNDTLVNVFVWVSKGVQSTSGSATPDKVKIDQVGCVYVPHVSAVMVDQDLQLVNSDDTLHNVKMNSDNNGSFNEGMPVKGMVLSKKFSKQEIGIPLKCDVHPWMGAYLHVMEHPYYAVTGSDGTFEIRGLPAGQYEVSVWHEFDKFTPDHAVTAVALGDGETKEITVTYSPPGKKK